MLKHCFTTKPFLLGATLLWLGLILFAMTRLQAFEGSAGPAGQPLPQWPRTSPVALDPGRPTLIMLVHPHCPCSRASLTELNHLAAVCPHQAAISVLFLKPAGCTPAWAKTDLWRQASAIPGVHVGIDTQGDLARSFGAETSGETVLYAPDGRLLYRGGLTGARGHEGDNTGLSAVMALLSGRTKKQAQEPVYGCPMTADRRTSRVGGRSWLP